MSKNSEETTTIEVNLLTLEQRLIFFQSEIGNIAKKNIAKVKTNSGAEYQYSYASFETIVEAIRPLLFKFNLGFYHKFLDNRIVCVLFDSDGHQIESSLELVVDSGGRMSLSQQQGAAITYAKRYTLSAILGLVTDEDTDGNVDDSESKLASKSVKQSAPDLPWLRLNSPEFHKLAEAVENYSEEEIFEMARKKYQLDPMTEKAIRDLYINLPTIEV